MCAVQVDGVLDTKSRRKSKESGEGFVLSMAKGNESSSKVT